MRLLRIGTLYTNALAAAIMETWGWRHRDRKKIKELLIGSSSVMVRNAFIAAKLRAR